MTTFKQKLGVVLWALKTSFLICPQRLIVNTISTLISKLVPVYIAVYVGQTINVLTGFSQAKLEPKTVILVLVKLGIILLLDIIIHCVPGMISAAVSLDLWPKNGERLIRMINNIPIKLFDDSKFCDRFAFAVEGSDNIHGTAEDVCNFMANSIGFAVSLGVVLNTSPRSTRKCNTPP